MKRTIAQILMLALGAGVLVGIALAQDEAKKEAPRPRSPSRKYARFKEDAESVAKTAPRDRGPFPKGAELPSDADPDASAPQEKEMTPARSDAEYAPARNERGLTERLPRRQDNPTANAGGETAPYPQDSSIAFPAKNLRGPAGRRALPMLPRPAWESEAVGMASGEGSLAEEAEHFARMIGAARSDAEKDKLKDQLSDTLEKQFELRQKRHENEIAELEAQVRKLRGLVKKRLDNRHEIVAKRLEMILRDAEGLGW
jgi:hypothetical protein